MGLTHAEKQTCRYKGILGNEKQTYQALIFAREEVRYWFWVLGLILGRTK